MNALDKADGVRSAAEALQNQADTMTDSAYAAQRTAVEYRRRMAATRPFCEGWGGSLRAAGGYCPRDDVTEHDSAVRHAIGEIRL